MFGELDGIAEQVDDHLPQSVGVADEENSNAAGNAPPQREAFRSRAEFDNFQRLVDDFPHIEVHRFQLDLAGFHFGQVKNIVDQVQQSNTIPLKDIHTLLLFGRQRGP